jgi:hypothetical protein
MPVVRPAIARAILPLLLLLLLLSNISCDKSTTTPTPANAAPTVTDDYSGTLRVGGAGFYSFSLVQAGTINLTLNSLGGDPASTVMIGLGIGVPSGSDCAATNTVNAAPGTAVAATGSYPVGVYCARVFDVGNLTDPTTFDLSIAHP